MHREEAIEQVMKTISNMNGYGLGMVIRWIEGLDGIELMNANTTPERIQEILDQWEQERKERAAQEEQQKAAHQEGKEKKFFADMKDRIDRRNQKIASFTGRERKFWDKIETVMRTDIERYVGRCWQMALVADLYDNNYIDASYTEFCFGFYQGMQYMKNHRKKQQQTRKDGAAVCSG